MFAYMLAFKSNTKFCKLTETRFYHVQTITHSKWYSVQIEIYNLCVLSALLMNDCNFVYPSDNQNGIFWVIWTDLGELGRDWHPSEFLWGYDLW